MAVARPRTPLAVAAALALVLASFGAIVASSPSADAATRLCTRSWHVGRVIQSGYGPLRCVATGSGYQWVSALTATPATGVERAVLDRVNLHRIAAGVAPLALCGRLSVQARNHALDQNHMQQMSHTGSDGSSLRDRAFRSGYLPGSGTWKIGENVAFGYADADRVVAAWMASPGHRANIVDPGFQHLGVGAASGNGSVYWAQEFGAGGTC